MMAPPVLAGKRVLITGAGAGLGRAYSLATADAGASVLVADTNCDAAEETTTLITAAGGTAIASQGDVTDWNACAALVEKCVDEFGGIDGLVNNAGILGSLRTLLEETEANVRRTLDVNVLGTIAMATHAARAMVDAGNGGTIVNVSSGNQCGHQHFATYGASKGAASSLVYAWARELETYGIRVNAISPNADTGMIEGMVAELGGNPEHNTFPSVEDNASVVVYLLSDASAQLNGQIVRMDTDFVSVMAHPVVAAPRVPMKHWDVAALEQVFSGPLKNSSQPLGISIAEVKHVQSLH